MIIKRLLPALGILFYGISVLFAQPKIIFDTDFGGDGDDLGALAMLHNFTDHGECELLAIMSWSTEESVVPAIDAVNHYYKHPKIPIGVRKEGIHTDGKNYSRPIAQKFHYELTSAEAPDATELYRMILAEQEDNSVTIVTVGPLKNIMNLINSEPDDYSTLSGEDLIGRKVKEFVVMGGNFPEGKNEWNFNGNMPGVTRFVLEHLDVPVTFSGFELGVRIKTGATFNQIDRNTPLYIGFMHFSEHAPWMKKYFRGKILDNSSYDQTAVLYAVRKGTGDYWEKRTGGLCIADDHGGNRWITGEVSNHSYLELIMDTEEMAELIESIMLNQF